MVSTRYDGFPGGVGVSRLRVYDWPTLDGLPGGGTPHLHLTCNEGYVVVAGSGAVQTLTASGYAETPLEPGTVAWFTPGTIHRLVNSGGLEIVVVMENTGLPEAGDAVLTLPPDLLADASSYADAVRLPSEGSDAERGEAARRRRDLATGEFLELREACERGETAPLQEFLRAAASLVSPHADEWERRLEAGPGTAVRASADQVRAVRTGDPAHLCDARVQASGPAERGRYGMCGRLDVYPGI